VAAGFAAQAAVASADAASGQTIGQARAQVGTGSVLSVCADKKEPEGLVPSLLDGLLGGQSLLRECATVPSEVSDATPAAAIAGSGVLASCQSNAPASAEGLVNLSASCVPLSTLQ
jgi:hypothetical protein